MHKIKKPTISNIIMYRHIKKISFILLILFITTISLNSCFFGKALIYQKANIDDYKIFNNRTIKAGNYQPWEKSKNYNKFKINEKYTPDFKKFKTVAFVIIKDKKLLHEQYWLGYNENSLSNSFSMAKSFISLLVGFAIDDGKIKNINQKVGDFIPEFSKGDNAKLTIKNLITMSSGLNWKESYGSPFTKTTQAYYGHNLKKLILKLKVTEEPGKEFKYLSGNTQLLALIVEKAVGKNISEYISEKLWKPIGAKNDALWCLDKKNGTEKAYCCFNSNAKDFARIGQFCLDKGKWNKKQLLSSNYITESFKPDTFLTFNNKPVNFYGYMWWMGNYKGHHITYARGILGQYIFIIPDYNAIVVRLGHKRSKKRKMGVPADIFTYLDAAFDILQKNKS